MCYDSTVQERRTAWRQTSSSTPPPPPRGLTPDRPPLGSPTGPRRDATRSSREWPTNPALAVCIPHSTNAVCTTRENGIQQPPTAVLAEDWIGFDPHRQRIDHTAPRMCHTLPPNNITRQKAQVRLAAPSAGRGGFGTFGWATWAADLTRNHHSRPPPRAATSHVSNLKSTPAAFSARRLTRKPSGHPRRLEHPTI